MPTRLLDLREILVGNSGCHGNSGCSSAISFTRLPVSVMRVLHQTHRCSCMVKDEPTTPKVKTETQLLLSSPFWFDNRKLSSFQFHLP